MYGRVSLIATWRKGYFAVRPTPTERAWKAMLPNLLADSRAGEAEKAAARIKAPATEVPKEKF